MNMVIQFSVFTSTGIIACSTRAKYCSHQILLLLVISRVLGNESKQRSFPFPVSRIFSQATFEADNAMLCSCYFCWYLGEICHLEMRITLFEKKRKKLNLGAAAIGQFCIRVFLSRVANSIAIDNGKNKI